METRAYWETDEAMQANRRDHILKRLEIEEIAKYVGQPSVLDVLDIGCGDGETAIELAHRFCCNILAVDRSQAMIQAAWAKCGDDLFKASLQFAIADVQNLNLGPRWSFSPGHAPAPGPPAFDLIYTERCLINLPDWPTQAQAIQNILALLKPGGRYLMVEHSQDGLSRLNKLRVAVGLPAIEPPWHNRYLREAELHRLAGIDGAWIGHHFASDYYYHSRVINAWLAAQEGKEPDYDAPINRLAESFPEPVTADLGPAAIWTWRKV